MNGSIGWGVLHVLTVPSPHNSRLAMTAANRALSYERETMSEKLTSFCDQVGETTGNEIRPFLQSRIIIPIRLCSLPIHSPCLCLLLAIG